MADVIEVRAQRTGPMPLISQLQRPIKILRSLLPWRWFRRRRLASIPQPSVGKDHCKTNRPDWDSTTTWREAQSVELETQTAGNKKFHLSMEEDVWKMLFQLSLGKDTEQLEKCGLILYYCYLSDSSFSSCHCFISALSAQALYQCLATMCEVDTGMYIACPVTSFRISVT